ncbi:P1 family peptidase [Culicoidibacter larvae]|uniref:P1 family peptidase n=2 Tax=Culicoidibacter larvae TaxID=2579976 RepID=A0A5R8QGC4_9FIRM|nr:P1 family peptidase [Culicoidibacter larvae]
MMNKFASGLNDLITDVQGVRVGHSTLSNGDVQTGVTTIIPHGGNLFLEKLPAAVHVMNGFGKSSGLIQIEELGQLESPILLTNTFSVGVCTEALIEYMLADNPDIGERTGTINTVVAECNDGYLNDIRGMHVRKQHVFEALRQAESQFDLGAVGAGRGMSCYQLKGGIGSSSRLLTFAGQTFTIGALVLSNFGRLEDLVLDGRAIGRELVAAMNDADGEHRDLGSIIVVLATDLPLDARQLKRLAKRAGVGIARTGSYVGNGSGEIAVAFSTAESIAHYAETVISNRLAFHEDSMEQVFAATAEVVETAIAKSLWSAETVSGKNGCERMSLRSVLEDTGLTYDDVAIR